MSSFKAYLLVLVLMSPWSVFAAGLGKLTINSALGQPLQAEIDLVAVNNEELSSLAAQLGSQEAFRQAGIDYKPFFSTFKVSIEPRSNGDPYIKITSPNGINEPFLNMLVELNWSSGRLMREYTVLLDPVETDAPQPVTPIVSNTDTVASQAREKEISSATSKQATPLPKQEPASVAGTQPGSTTYGPVIQGDTLSAIARQISPQGVSLNQVLIALFRANREAFIEDNMNLLKVGVILKIPDRSEIAAISEAEANQEVKIQVADWREYRNRLVVAASESSVHDEIKQSDAGQITTSMAEEAVVKDEPPKEVLRVSSGISLDETATAEAGENVTPQERLRMMEEDAIARNLALQEANERIAILEKNILDLQRLLELQNPTLAQAQIEAENMLLEEQVGTEMLPEQAPEDSLEPLAVTEADSAAVVTDTTDLLADLHADVSSLATDADTDAEAGAIVADSTASISEEAIVPTGTSEPFMAPAGEITPAPEPSLIDQLIRNSGYIGAAAAFLLLGTLAVIRMRRKKAEEDLDADEEAVAASAALRERLASVAAVDALATQSPAAEPMETDSAGQEEALASEELDEAPMVDASDAAEEDFDAKAAHDEMSPEGELHQESDDSFSQTDETDDEVNIDLADMLYDSQSIENEQQADDVELNLDLDVPSDDAELAEEAAQKESELSIGDEAESLLETPQAAENATNDAVSEDELNLDITEPEDSQNEHKPQLAESEVQAEVETVPFESNADISLDLNVPADESLPTHETEDATSTADQIEALDMALELPEDTDDAAKQAEEGQAEEAVAEAQPSASQDEAMDLDLQLESTEDSENADTNLLASDSSVTDLKSEMNIPSAETEEALAETETPEELPMAGEKDAQWHEVETKIDLARAYLDMEDVEGAREILEEVVNEGDAQQQEQAKAMLAKL